MPSDPAHRYAPLGTSDFVRCESCEAMHHPDYHKPFRWGRRVLLHVAWADTKRLARAYWKAIVHG